MPVLVQKSFQVRHIALDVIVAASPDPEWTKRPLGTESSERKVAKLRESSALLRLAGA